MSRTPWQFVKRRIEDCVKIMHAVCPKCGKAPECDPTHWRGWVEHVKVEEPCTWEEVLDQSLQEYKGWLSRQYLIQHETNKILQTSAINETEVQEA